MDFSLTEDQCEVRDLAARILTPLAPTESETDYPSVGAMGPDATAHRRLAEANLLGISLSEGSGGSEMGLTASALVVEQAGAAAARVPLVALMTAAMALDRFAPEAHRDLLTGVATGERLVSAALTEPRALDHQSIRTLAEPDGEGWLVTGEKSAVAAADRADRILVPARTPRDEIVLLLVDPTAAGVEARPQRATSGDLEFHLTLEGAQVEVGNVVAGPDTGHEALSFFLGRASLLTAAFALGLAQRQLDLTAAYVSQREQFGVPIGTFQGVAMRVANMLVDVEAMRATLWQALWRVDADLPSEEEIAIAKFWASEAGERVASSAVHLHGGIGVDTDYPLHHYFLRSKATELSLGSASWQIDRLGQQIAARAGAPA